MRACAYCGGVISALSANPSEWPVPFPHQGDEGRPRLHCMKCVSTRCAAHTGLQWDNERLQAENARLRELLAQCRPYVDEARCMEDSAQRHNFGGDPAPAEALLAAIDAATGGTK